MKTAVQLATRERRRRDRSDPPSSHSSSEAEIARARQRRSTLSRIHNALLAGDVGSLIAGFAIANAIVYGPGDIAQLGRVLSVSIPLLIGFGLNAGTYGPRRADQTNIPIITPLKPLAMTAATLMLIAFMLKVGAQFSRAQFVMGMSLSGALLCSVRIVVEAIRAPLFQNGLHAELHIYDGVDRVESPKQLAIDARACGLAADLRDAKAVNHLGYLARGMDSVIVHCKADSRLAWAQALRTLDVPAEIVIPELATLDALHIRTSGTDCLVRLNDGRLAWDKAILKRAFDVALVIALLPLLALIVLVVGMAIKLDSAGPVFFRQDRIGIGNRAFRIWKFRTMQYVARDAATLRLTERRDARVTRVGGLLRRLSIDELPQLFNVLKGDMSLVGPRPHAAMARAGERLYWEVDQFYWHRHVVKPGITGLAQVRGFRGNTFVEDNLRDRLRADLEYVRKWSLLLDLKILLGTLLAPFDRNAF